MAYGALIAYRNKVWDSTLDYDTAPGGTVLGDLNVLKTPQLGETVTIIPHAPVAGPYFAAIEIVLDEVATIGVIGVLNASNTLTGYKISLFDAADDPLLTDGIATFVDYPTEEYIPPNFWRVFDTPYTGVKRIVVRLEMLDSEGLITAEESPITLGGLWAGPAWVLDTVDAAWSLDVSENAVVVESDGNQTRAMPARKFRTIKFRLSSQTERQAYGIDDTAKVSGENSLLDLYMYSGYSRPVVAFPRLSTAVRQAAMGVYGYLRGNLQIRASSGPAAGDEPSLHSSGDLTVRESL
jgi:hypothetical protein